jgi:23S rRNA pseudouridine1911/1915/1917 synthase
LLYLFLSLSLSEERKYKFRDMREYYFEVEKDDSAKRLDIYLVENLKGNFSRSFIQGVIRQGLILVNDKISKPNQHLKIHDKILVKIPETEEINLEPQDIPLEIIYEDEDLAIINKPSGLVVHPGKGNSRGTLVNALLGRAVSLSRINPLRPGIVHRLDKDTSGLMIVAKNDAAHLALVKQFQEQKVKKRYIALVEGRVELEEGVIDLPIKRHSLQPEKMTVGFLKGRRAITRYRVLKRFSNSTLLDLTPQTGRMHQLRVHLAYLGHPIMGDSKYGNKSSLERLALHAKEIAFVHPRSGKYLEFSSDLPGDFQKWLQLQK